VVMLVGGARSHPPLAYAKCLKGTSFEPAGPAIKGFPCHGEVLRGGQESQSAVRWRCAFCT
jgi:hypothetical protein